MPKWCRALNGWTRTIRGTVKKHAVGKEWAILDHGMQCFHSPTENIKLTCHHPRTGWCCMDEVCDYGGFEISLAKDDAAWHLVETTRKSRVDDKVGLLFGCLDLNWHGVMDMRQNFLRKIFFPTRFLFLRDRVESRLDFEFPKRPAGSFFEMSSQPSGTHSATHLARANTDSGWTRTWSPLSRHYTQSRRRWTVGPLLHVHQGS